MATTTHDELAYDLRTVVERHLKRKGIPKPKTFAEEMVPDLINQIPREAFDPKQPWSTGKIFFHGDVCEENVLEAQFEIITVHQNLKPSVPITLYLSSVGGDCYAGIALISTIQEVRRAGRRVNIHIQGCAMSMGSVIAQVGDLRTIEPSAFFMVHNIASWFAKNELMKTPFVEDEAKTLAMLEQQIFSHYTARTGKPVDFWRKLFHRKDVYLTAEQSLELNLVDEIAIVPAYPRQRRSRKVA